jgi:hypothetical protein
LLQKMLEDLENWWSCRFLPGFSRNFEVTHKCRVHKWMGARLGTFLEWGTLRCRCLTAREHLWVKDVI